MGAGGFFLKQEVNLSTAQAESRGWGSVLKLEGAHAAFLEVNVSPKLRGLWQRGTVLFSLCFSGTPISSLVCPDVRPAAWGHLGRKSSVLYPEREKAASLNSSL